MLSTPNRGIHGSGEWNLRQEAVARIGEGGQTAGGVPNEELPTCLAMSAIIISPRGPLVSVGSLWELRDEIRREVEPDYQVGIHLREEVRGAEVREPFVDIVVEGVVRGSTVDSVVSALKAATERWRASEAAPSLEAAPVRVWVYDHDGQLHMEWEEKTGDGE